MKRLKLFIVTLLSLIILPGVVNAASGKITVSSTSTIVVGNKVTVTVKLSAGASWEMNLNYDKNYLQLVSGGGEAGGTKMVNTSTGKPNRTYTFTFKTLKKGSTTVKVGSYYIVDDNFNTMSITNNSKTIKIITQAELEASYSKDNNLKSLEVEGYELIPEFKKDTLDYSVNVPEGTTSITVKAKENDSKASVSGDGAIEVTEGINNVSVVVRAENGSEKTYNLIVNVIDQNPINVEVNDINYTVIKLRKNYTCPDLFSESEITINEFQIPACVNEKINYTLVGLKQEDGTIENFIYENGKYTKYSEIVGTSLRIIAQDYNGEIDGLTKSTENINDKEYQVFKFNESSRFYVVYGTNVETGEKDFYVYDSKNNTFNLYDTEYIDYLKDLNKTYLYVIIAFGLGLFLSLICIISISRSKSKLKKKYKKEKFNNKPSKKSQKEKLEKIEKEIEEKIIKENVNELKEEINKKDDTLVYDLFEDDKKKTTKRTKK
ncbi:MAG: hypothetical protein E7161_00520 [Firmicutes bacterium]|nr:hypothetical protein [Bacillota bacterium]